MATYTIFGAGPSGLYTAWRLLSGSKLVEGDTVELIEWGNYAFTDVEDGTRKPAGRICSHHYQEDAKNSYIEVGGMRYIEWNTCTQEGHQLVTITIQNLGLNEISIPFNTTTNPFFYLRGKAFYQSDLEVKAVTAPYNTPENNEKPDTLFGNISKLLIGDSKLDTRAKQCSFYATGVLPPGFNSSVYKPKDTVSNIGYWNVFYDLAGNEGYNYAADAGGYSSNVINWNAADGAVYNGEFAPGGSFKTLNGGFSTLFGEMYDSCRMNAVYNGITFNFKPSTRLHSIWTTNGNIQYNVAHASDPDHAVDTPNSTDYAFLAMPPHAIELVSRATRYIIKDEMEDFLNDDHVRNYLGAVIEQPSYKVAMFFDEPWWKNSKFPPDLTNSAHNDENVYGPTITDLPLRQIYYFGNNAANQSAPPVYGLLASYDDMRFTQFWEELEIPVSDRRSRAKSQETQPIEGPGQASEEMINMLRLELAKVHYGDAKAIEKIPAPLETRFMNWGYDPFGAGYHAWAAHYNICDVMNQIRQPAKMAGASNENVFIVGSAFSNDQAWVEGAFCTAESVLTDILEMKTIAADTKNYPLICSTC